MRNSPPLTVVHRDPLNPRTMGTDVIFLRGVMKKLGLLTACFAAALTVNGNCGGGGGPDLSFLALMGITPPTPEGPAPTYTVGGTITGLAGGQSVTIQLNGSENKTVTTVGSSSFTFSTSFSNAASYRVFVTANTGTTCMASSNIGTIPSSNVTNVAVVCSATTYTLNVNVTGLEIVGGNQIVFQNNGTNDLTVTANGVSANFSQNVPAGAGYAVSVKTNPSTRAQTCTPSGNTGTMSANKTVTVACGPAYYTVGGTTASTNGVQGLAGSGLQVRLNNTMEVLTFNTPPTSANIAFVGPIADGATYQVVVITQPTNLNQTCTVTNGNGTMSGSNITNVKVACVTNQYTVSGSVTGLSSGDSFTLLMNGGSNHAVSFASPNFSWNLADGTVFAVTVSGGSLVGSIGKTCTVNGAGSGTIAGANVTTVSVTCSFNTFTVGGSVTGLCSGQSIQVRNNGGDTQTVNGNTTFTFGAQNDLSAYSVTVVGSSVPTGVTCTPSSASGNLAGANVTNVAVACTGCMSCAGSSSVTVTWPASRSYEVNNASGGGHVVYYFNSSGFTTSTTGVRSVTVLNTESTTSKTLTGLTSGGVCTYYVKIKAFSAINGTGTSLSSESSVTIP